MEHTDMSSDVMTIVTLGVMETIKNFIREQLSHMALDIKSLRTTEELSTFLGNRNINTNCVLIDTDYLLDKGQNFCRTARTYHKSVPILMLSSERDKLFYINAIKWGVTGFVVKPFKNETLRGKLLECSPSATEKNTEMITFDLHKYLKGEHRKAEKGNFSLSLMFVTVVLMDVEDQNDPASQSYYSNLFYKSIKDLFWDTDAFIKFNSKYYLGVFPFCGRKNLVTIRQKINDAFNALYTEKNMPESVELVTVFATYPDDAQLFEDLQKILVERVDEMVSDSRIEWFI
jgi:CheY-like chemotaxis protein